MTYRKATLGVVDELILDDPDGLAVLRAVAKDNCRRTFEYQRDRVRYFVGRMSALCQSPKQALIVLINVDDPVGRDLADVLVPGHDWQVYRDRGEVPFARGLAGRPEMETIVQELDPETGEKLRALTIAVVVFDHGTIEVFEAEP